MSICKVEFIAESGQKIVLDFNVTDDNQVEFKPSYDPPITDPRTVMGLAGELCARFVTMLTTKPEIEDNKNESESEN